MNHTTLDPLVTPPDSQLDPEVVAFRQNFDDRSPLDQLVREGARRMLQEAINLEVDLFLLEHQDRRDAQGRRLVVKNGSLPARKILTGAGAIDIRQGRVRDNSPHPDSRVQFTPSVLPAYLRRIKAIEELIPRLYLKGISTGDFSEALQSLVGEQAKGLKEQRCWVHKTANVLNNLPKSVQPRAKRDLHEIWQAETRADATKAFDHFLEKYGAKYESACACLRKDRDELLTFYEFPAEHWAHLRTTNPLESTFATIRLRHRKTKGNGTRRASLTMMFKLAQSASKSWRRLRSHEKMTLVLAGRSFQDGIMQDEAAA